MRRSSRAQALVALPVCTRPASCPFLFSGQCPADAPTVPVLHQPEGRPLHPSGPHNGHCPVIRGVTSVGPGGPLWRECPPVALPFATGPDSPRNATAGHSLKSPTDGIASQKRPYGLFMATDDRLSYALRALASAPPCHSSSLDHIATCSGNEQPQPRDPSCCVSASKPCKDPTSLNTHKYM